MIKFLLNIFAFFLASTASAHTGMEQSSILHNTIHIMLTVGLYLAIIGVGFYLLNKLPKAKQQHIKSSRK